MRYASKHKKKFYVFIVYTLTTRPTVATSIPRKNFRSISQTNTKLIVYAMSVTDFSIADQDDVNMIDMSGFDSNGLEMTS